MSDHAPTPCAHINLVFDIKSSSFTDLPGRMLDFSGECRECGAKIHFVGAPFGVSMNRPTTDFEGTELRLPIVLGDEKHVPGVEVSYRQPDLGNPQ